MTPRKTTFHGPSASWADDDDGVVYAHVLADAAQLLSKKLEQRLEALRSADDLEVILCELRCQLAEAAVTGHLSAASDLHDLAMEVLTAREHRRTL